MIRFVRVYKTYKTGTDALKDVSFRIERGEFVFVIGKSGSGKSTLIKLLTREEKPSSGVVYIDHFPVSKMPRSLVPVLRRHVGMIFQDFRLIETKNVFENVAFAGEIVGMPRKKLIQTVEIVLNIVGLRHKASALPQELSGGEQQRVAIARAMVNDPELILADEPTGNLDPTTSEAIMALLEEINRNGTTVVICTHDSNLVDRMKKRVIEISNGSIVRDEQDAGYTCGDPEGDEFAEYCAAPEFPAEAEFVREEEDPDDSEFVHEEEDPDDPDPDEIPVFGDPVPAPQATPPEENGL